MKTIKCPYNDFECTELDTSGMSISIPCSECENYNMGIRPTGAIPVLAWIIEKLKNLFKKSSSQ